MTTQSPTNTGGAKSNLGNVAAVALAIWLLFFGGFSTLKNILTPARLSQITSAVDTIKTGADRVTRGAPTTRPIPTQRAGQPPANPPANQAQIEAAAQAAFQATAQAADVAVAPALPPAAPPNVNDPQTWPTAVIAIPTAPAVVVPIAYPQTYASNDPPTVTPIPTMAYPTPLPAAATAFELSPDGKCVTVAARGGRYQTCQDWPYSAAEAASVADYLRTGLIPGTKVV